MARPFRLGAREPLLQLTAQAATAAGTLLDHATDAVRAWSAALAPSTRSVLAREQHAVHGLAWLATCVEALRQLQGWAERLEGAGTLGELERDLLAVAFGEYLARILGGIPMSQGETIRLPALGVDPAAIEALRPGRGRRADPGRQHGSPAGASRRPDRGRPVRRLGPRR